MPTRVYKTAEVRITRILLLTDVIFRGELPLQNPPRARYMLCCPREGAAPWHCLMIVRCKMKTDCAFVYSIRHPCFERNNGVVSYSYLRRRVVIAWCGHAHTHTHTPRQARLLPDRGPSMPTCVPSKPRVRHLKPEKHPKPEPENSMK